MVETATGELFQRPICSILFTAMPPTDKTRNCFTNETASVYNVAVRLPGVIAGLGNLYDCPFYVRSSHTKTETKITSFFSFWLYSVAAFGTHLFFLRS
jgi:hypothetical protein